MIKAQHPILNEKHKEEVLDERTVQCPCCDEMFTEDEERDDFQEDYNGDMVCDDCFHNSSFKCPDCESILSQDDGYTCEWLNAQYCEDCFYERARYCDKCGQYYDPDDINYVEEEGCDICNNCYSDSYFYCSECGENYSLDKGKYNHKGSTLCKDCYDDVSFTYHPLFLSRRALKEKGERFSTQKFNL